MKNGVMEIFLNYLFKLWTYKQLKIKIVSFSVLQLGIVECLILRLIFLTFLKLPIVPFFTELNTTGNSKASSSSKQAQGGGLFFVQKYLYDGQAHKTVKFGDLDIEVWLDSSRSKVVKAWYPNCGIPYGDFYKDKEFLIRLIELEGLQLVAYKAYDNSLIGVRAPNKGK